MHDLETIRSKPIWRLWPDELDALPKQEQEWAIRLLGDMRADGSLAMLCANGPGTKYEVGWDRGGKQWALRPICTCPRSEPRRFIEAYFEYRPETESD